MPDTVPEATSSWRFDYKLNISTLITVVSAIIAIASMGATLQKRLEVVEHTNQVISMELKETRLMALQVARIETRLDAVHHSIASLRDEIRTKHSKAH